MDAGEREIRRRKYLNLGIGELTAAAVFVLVGLFSVTPRLPRVPDQIALWCALIPLVVVLVVAGLYWLLARAWVGRTTIPAATAATYRMFRVAILVLLCGGLAGIIAWWPDNIGVAIFIMVVWVFAVIEFVNYFILRLSYPVRRWLTTVKQWRTPQLAKDIRKV